MSQPLATTLFMKNVGTNKKPAFAPAVPSVHSQLDLVQMDGTHEGRAISPTFGGNGPNLLGGMKLVVFFFFVAPILR